MSNKIEQEATPVVHTPQSHPYEKLSPDLVMDAVEANGFLTDARILALNSYDTLNVHM
jgi:2-C-methyl-D-erythritol 4-phosphate cytidylyltransferase